MKGLFIFITILACMNPASQYILKQAEPFRSILLELQVFIETTVPNVVLQYKWGLPFYTHIDKKGFCYLNCTKDYIDLVFWNGAHITKNEKYLTLGNRKHMKSLRYFKLEDIDAMILINVLNEAYQLRDKKYYK
jgi:hypothetical protein